MTLQKVYFSLYDFAKGLIENIAHYDFEDRYKNKEGSLEKNKRGKIVKEDIFFIYEENFANSFKKLTDATKAPALNGKRIGTYQPVYFVPEDRSWIGLARNHLNEF